MILPPMSTICSTMIQTLKISDGVENIAILLMRQEVAVWMVGWEYFRGSESNSVRTSLPKTELVASKNALLNMHKHGNRFSFNYFHGT